jgi:hypothetical protein
MSVFVYGTLMAPEVLQALILRVPEAVPGKGIDKRKGGWGDAFSTRHAPSLDPPTSPPSFLSTIPTRAARLPGHRRHALRAQVFPAAVPSPAHSISGLLLTGLSQPERAVFDAFEGEEYRKAGVEVEVGVGVEAALAGGGGGGEPPAPTIVAAEVYLWRPALAAELLDGEWEYGAFRDEHLGRYTAGAAAFGVGARAAVGGGDGAAGWPERD